MSSFFSDLSDPAEDYRLEKFVNKIFKNEEYLFVNNCGDKIEAHCSACGHEFEVDHIEHNRKTVCPQCSAKLIEKNAKFGKKKLMLETCVYWFEKSKDNPDMVICQGLYVTKNYMNYKYPSINYKLNAVYTFDKIEAKMYKESYYSGARLTGSIYDFNVGWLANKGLHFSKENLKETVEGTIYQYNSHNDSKVSIVRWLDLYREYPLIESLSKIGLGDIVASKAYDFNKTYGAINWRGKTIWEMLKITRGELKEIKEAKITITPAFLKLYQLSKKNKPRLSVKEVGFIKTRYTENIYSLDELINIAKKIPLRKAANYIEKQHKSFGKHFHSRENISTTWRDYMADCKTLGLDLNNESILYPKDLYKAHQETIKQVRYKVDEELNKKIRDRAKTLEKFMFEYNGLLIRPAVSQKELIAEGEKLVHCVGGYAKRYANAETNIFVIRKIEEKDKPYYTVEIKNKKIAQVRGYRNKSPEEEVKLFIEKFEKEVLKKSKRKGVA